MAPLGNKHYAVKQLQAMMTFCHILELQAIPEVGAIITVHEMALCLKYVCIVFEQCQWYFYL